MCLQGKYQRRVFSGICDKRCAPVLVEAATALLGKVISPDGGDGTEATRGLDVANHADDNHRWALNDGDSLAHFLLVCLGAWLVDLTGDVGHASLVASEGGEVAFLGCVILREGLDLTAVALATLAGKEPEGTVTWSFKLTVGHCSKGRTLDRRLRSFLQSKV